MKKDKALSIWVILLCAFTLISTMLILDYFNIPSNLFPDISLLNLDLISCLVSNVIVISIFLVTYTLIDRNNIEKSKNQTQVVYELIKRTYQSCVETIKLFDNQEITIKAVAKCDFSITILEDKHFLYFRDLPFKYEALIIDSASNGNIMRDELHTFLSLQQDFYEYLYLRITFFDACEAEDPSLHFLIIDKRNKLMKSLITEMEKY